MKVGSKDFLAERGIKAWATVPLEYLKREIAPDRCADSRVRHGMILWSWCGPEATEYVSVRDEDTNKPILDEKGQPIPARRSDLARLLGMDKGNLSRFLKRFKRKGSVVFEAGRMYLIYKPTAFDPKTEKVVSTTTFHIADIVVSTDNLPTDEVVRTEALRLCEEASTAWKNALNNVRTVHRELFRPRALALGILIDKRKRRKTSREEGTGGRSSSIRESASATAGLTVRPPAPLPSIRENLKTWLLGRFATIVPTPLDDKILDRIAAHIPDAGALEQFQKAAANIEPRKWGAFLSIAIECEKHRPAYEGPRPLSSKAQAQADRMQRIYTRLKAKRAAE